MECNLGSRVESEKGVMQGEGKLIQRCDGKCTGIKCTDYSVLGSKKLIM